MHHKIAGLAAAALVAAGFAGLAPAANAKAMPARRPAWRVIYAQAAIPENGEFEAVVATGRSSGFAFLEPGTTVAVPSAYERTGAATFGKVPFPVTADEWVAGASASSPSDVYVFADILTAGARPRAESRVLKWNGRKFTVVASFPGELSGGTVLSPRDVYAYGSSAYGGGTLPSAGVYHYNGRSWTRISRTVSGYGDALSARSVYVADGTNLYHYNGRSWQVTSLARLFPGGKASALFSSGVVAVSPRDIYVTGNSGTGSGRAVILHYNGCTWARVASYPVALGQPVSDGRGGLWAATAGPGSPALVRYADGRLTSQATPEYDGVRSFVSQISRVPGTTEELAGGELNALPAGKSYRPAVILQYGS